ncbi:MAG: hypothetical protein AAFQ54_08040 [Pseudomonadota bacterium]
MSDDPEHPYAALRLESVRPAGRSLGLQAGDTLVRIDGACFDGSRATLKARVAMAGSRGCMLSFSRAGLLWQVAIDTARLGRWRHVPLPEGIDIAPQEVSGEQNWDVWVDPDGAYDALPAKRDGFALLVPLNLIRLRLWSALALWGALLVVSVMLGPWVGTAVQVVVWIYFWRITPALVRQDWVARGFRLWKVMAARSETALHAELAARVPQIRFVHARPGR